MSFPSFDMRISKALVEETGVFGRLVCGVTSLLLRPSCELVFRFPLSRCGPSCVGSLPCVVLPPSFDGSNRGFDTDRGLRLKNTFRKVLDSK